MNTLHPLLLEPTYRDYIWGGERIPDRFNRALPPGRYAESWEVADRPEGQSVVADGPHKGKSLRELLEQYGEALLGRGRTAAHFPLLVKLIDARETLSVQVHPNNENAHRTGGEPKTEMWYVLEAEPGACVYAGIKPGVTPEILCAALKENRAEELLIKIPVRAHDAVFMPGGRVHAIGGGCLILECQQNSNTTYRLHDWGRVDAQGNARELHIEPALQVINWSEPAAGLLRPHLIAEQNGNQRWEIASCPFFRMERLNLRSACKLAAQPTSFRVLFVAEGSLELNQPDFSANATPGTTLLIPATCPDLQLTPTPATIAMLMDVP